jgi:hypothetical protein
VARRQQLRQPALLARLYEPTRERTLTPEGKETPELIAA